MDKEYERELRKFKRELKARGGHILDIVATADGKPMVYYREPDSYATDVRTKVIERPRSLKPCPYVADGEVYNVREFYKENGLEQDIIQRTPKDWYEYRVWLIDRKGEEIISEWDSLFETYDGANKLTYDEATKSLTKILEDVNEECKYEDWFSIE